MVPEDDPQEPDRVSWTWDPSLYAGSAAHYAVGRNPYPRRLADDLVRTLELDGTGVLVDVGCGPGSLTLLLAPHVGFAVGVDADADMLGAAAGLAERARVDNVSWRHLRAEDLPADLPSCRLVTFAQSFHWTDRARVAAAVRTMLDVGGAVVHVGGMTHQGVEGARKLAFPRPPREEITALVRRYLGPRRRAGQGVLPSGTPGDDDAVFRAAGFTGPHVLVAPGEVVDRTAHEVAAAVYSLSSSAPHLFGDHLARFDAELRDLLARTGDEADSLRSSAPSRRASGAEGREPDHTGASVVSSASRVSMRTRISSRMGRTASTPLPAGSSRAQSR